MKRALWKKHGQHTASNTARTSKEKSRQETRKAARIEDRGAGLPMRRPRFAFLQTAVYRTILEEWSILPGNYPEMPVVETEPRAALSVPEQDFRL